MTKIFLINFRTMGGVTIHIDCGKDSSSCTACVCPPRVTGTVAIANLLCSSAFIILGVFTAIQPFDYRLPYDIPDALAMCLPPAVLSFISAFAMIWIYGHKEPNISIRLAAVISLVLCIYTAIVPCFASTSTEYWNRDSRSRQYKAIYIVSIINSVFSGIQTLIWLAVACIPSCKLFHYSTPPSPSVTQQANESEDAKFLLDLVSLHSDTAGELKPSDANKK